MSNHSMGRFLTLPVTAIIMLVIYIPLMLTPGGISDVKNKVLRWIFAMVIVIRLLYSAMLTISQFEYRVTCTAMPYISPIYFLAIIFAAALYGVHKGIQATARIAPISLTLYMVLIVLISLTVWDKVDIIRIYTPLSAPFIRGDNSIMYHSLMEVIRHDELFIFVALTGFVREKDGKSQARKGVLIFMPFVLVVGLWLNFLYNAVLGRLINYTACQMYTISSFSSFNIVERMDGFFITTAIVGGLLKIIMCFVCIRAVLSQLVDDRSETRAVKITTMLLLAGIIIPTYFVLGFYELFISDIMNICLISVMVIAALLLPAAVFISNIVKRKASS
jgi:hypothetical protein